MDVCNIIDKELAKVLMPHRQEISNKGTHGTVLNFCGCRTYVGAAYLSAVASLRVGAGISELAAPNYVKDRVASISPDLVYTDTESYAYHEVIPKNIDLSKYFVILVGCGLGNNKYTQKFMRKFTDSVKNLDIPVIYDADALNIIAKEEIIELGKKPVLTPHPGEMARLMGTEIADIQSSREDYARMAAQKYNATVVLKGHHTIVACSDGKMFKDVTGTSVLAKAGMGDVLAGIIAGLCSQSLNTRQAAVLGVYIHSQSGVYGEKIHTPFGMLASDLLKYIPEGIKSIIL